MKEILAETEKILTDPIRAIKVIVDTELPISQYKNLRKPHLVLNPATNKYEPAKVFGVEIPNFYARPGVVEKLWDEYKQLFNIQKTGDPENDSYMVDVEEWLRFIYLSCTYFSCLIDPFNLELIVRGDGFPVGDGHAVFMIVTCGNFGGCSKCLGFNFPINLAAISEKNREKVRKAFLLNLIKLNLWSATGKVHLFPELGISVNIRVEWGGDESWHRMMLGLQSSRYFSLLLLFFFLFIKIKK